jgi:WD40 repeat protein
VTSIFLSYARSDDEPFVQKLYDSLVARGFEVWFDRVSMPSRALTFLQEIRDAIDSRDRLIFVVGPGALASDYVKAEWQWALEIGKAINPVLRIGDYPDIPDELRLLDTQDFRDDARYAERFETLSRQLEDPVPPMGKLIGVRSLPAHFLRKEDCLRTLRDAVMADLHRPVVMTGTSVHVGVQGMGGIGKSVLAAALARDYEVRRAFPDGVIWVEVGQAPSLVQLQRTLAMALGDPGHFDTLEQGRTVLSGLLADRAILLILDDLWEGEHAKAFDMLGPKCRMVVTTRDAGLLTAFGGMQYQVQLLTTAEAKHLLAECAGVEEPQLPAVADEVIAKCGRLPLALAICGGMVHDGERWTDIRDALKEADLQFLDHPQGSVLKTIKVSITTLPADEVERFTELAVFSPDETVPESAVLTLWAQTGGLSPRSARSLLTRLGRRALVQLDMVPGATGEEQDRRVSLHDLIHDCARMRVGRNIVSLHQRLLDAYAWICPDGWATGPDDGYFLQHLCGHLLAAERQEEAAALLLDAVWIQRVVTAGLVYGLVTDFNLMLDSTNRQSTYLNAKVREALRLLQGALQLSQHILESCPDQLPTQLHGRLIDSHNPTIDQVLERLRSLTDRPWLRPVSASLAVTGGPLVRILTGHTNPVFAVAVTPDGLHAISGSFDKTLKVWDIETGRELHTLTGHTSGVIALAMTTDGLHAISGSLDKTLRVWNLVSGQELHTLAGHTHGIIAVAVTPDSCRVIFGSMDKTLKIWDLVNNRELHTLKGHTDLIWTVAVTPDGLRAISGSYDNTLKVWNLESGQELHTLKGHTGSVRTVAVTPDGLRAVSGSEDYTLKVWDLETGTELHTLKGHTGSVMAVAVTPDGLHAVSGSDDHTLKVWDIETGRKLYTLAGNSGLVSAVAVTPDGRWAVSGSWDNTLRVWDLEKGRELHTPEGHTGSVSAVAVTPDGLRAISGSKDKTLKVWNLEKGQELHTLTGHTEWVITVAVTPDGLRAVSGSGDNTLKIWDLSSDLELHTLAGHTEFIKAVAVTPDGLRAVSGSGDHTLKVWDLTSGEELATLVGHTGWINAVAITPDGRCAISGSEWPDGTLKVWDLESSRELATLAGHIHGVQAVAMTPDGLRAVFGLGDYTLKIWDLASGQELHTLAGHTRGIVAVAVTPDGRCVISGSFDNTLKIWDLTTGSQVASFSADGSIESVAFSDIMNSIIAGDQVGNFHILRFENYTPGPHIVTSQRDSPESLPRYRCPYCATESVVQEDDLGTVVQCPSCGRSIQLNTFVIVTWRPGLVRTRPDDDGGDMKPTH